MTDSRTTRCLFETFPTELLLKIISGLPDLTSLDSVLHASPTVYRIFDEYAVEITETVLSCDYKIVVTYNRRPYGAEEIHHGPHAIESGVTSAYIRVMFYMMAAIRSGRFPIHSLSEFCQKVVDPFWWKTTRRGRATLGYYMPQSLPKGTPPNVVRSLIATYRRLNWISMDCIRYYLLRFESRTPAIPAAFLRGCRVGPYINDAEALNEFRGIPIKGRDAGPPSWAEEQRSARAFWRLQLMYDLQKAGRGNLLDWPAEDLHTLRSYDQMQLLFLYDPTHVLHADPPRRPEKDEIYSASQYLWRAHKCHWPDEVPGDLRVTRREWWPLPRHDVRGDKKLAGASAGCQAWPSLAGHLGWWELSDAMRLGFAFWSEERLRGRGLLGNPREIGVWEAFKYAFAWHSMISGK
ncbi:hypothetical protein PG996_004695 [Apiospora saccharicola]|uniref:F-box domain-containing protein n=1 Tax=Apiospora saccharicola TaxID=335842 RepID=A0ABR1W4X7_9PEZI